jgi:DNA-directed RNA polymerase specialized sigma24 family protein
MSKTPASGRVRSSAVKLRQEITALVSGHLEPEQQLQVSEWVEALVATADNALVDAGPNSILLAALALDRQLADCGGLWKSGGSLITSLNDQIPRLRAMEVMADSGDLANDAGRFHEYAALAARFLDAIAPRSPATLLHQPKQLRERALWFSSLTDQPDSGVVERAELQLQDKLGYGESEARTLVWRLGVPRLRTIPPELLKTIAVNDRKWRPLVEVLTGARATSPELDAELQHLLGQLCSVVRRLWQTSDPGRIEDAVQDALAAAVESLRDPGRGYSFEGDFLAWLISAVLNRLRNHSRRPTGQPIPANLAARPTHSPETDVFPLLEEWRARYLLVETFFKGESVRRVKAIFEWMLLHAEEDVEEPDDSRLAQYIEMRTGEEVNKVTLAGTRRRLRQRLEALRYMRDLVTRGAPDSQGDIALLAHITAKFGLAKPDVSTIRALGGLARACPSPRCLHWARLLRCLVIGREDSLADIRQEAEKQNPATGPARGRLSRALQRQQQIHELRTWATAQHVVFLLAPCLCLVILYGRAGDEAVGYLKPGSSAEASGIQQMMSELAREISV